jgi:hypothetical protein
MPAPVAKPSNMNMRIAILMLVAIPVFVSILYLYTYLKTPRIDLSATHSIDSIEISWSRPALTEDKQVARYLIDRRPGRPLFYSKSTSEDTFTYRDDENLIIGQEYTYLIKALGPEPEILAT